MSSGGGSEGTVRQEEEDDMAGGVEEHKGSDGENDSGKDEDEAVAAAVAAKAAAAPDFKLTREEEVEKWTFLARLAERTEQWSWMVDAVKHMGGVGVQLNDAQRNLLAIAYLNVVGKLRGAWRSLRYNESEEHKRAADDSVVEWERLAAEEHRKVMYHYRTKVIEPELYQHCNDLINLVKYVLLPVEQRIRGDFSRGKKQAPCIIYYKKLVGDYYRYIAELPEDQEGKEAAARNVEGAYMDAKRTADTSLPPTSPLRLSLMLNISVFYYDVMGQADRALQLAREAFDAAMAELEDLDDKQYRDTSVVLQFIKDHINMWATELVAAEDEENSRLKAEAEAKAKADAERLEAIRAAQAEAEAKLEADDDDDDAHNNE